MLDAHDMLMSWADGKDLEGMMEFLNTCDDSYIDRPPTRPRQAQPWELRSQINSINTVQTWQQCPQRHRARESRGRWKEMQAS